MKILALMLALPFLTPTQVHASACERRIAPASGAASAMVAGYGALKWLNAVDLESKWTQVLGQGQRISFQSLRSLVVNDGDKITVQYRLSPNATRDAIMEAMEDEIRSLQQKLSYESSTYFRELRTNDPDFIRFKQLQAELAKMEQGLTPARGQVFTKVLKKKELAERFFLNLHNDQAWVTKVSRLPALRAQQIVKSLRNGAVIGSVALAFGLITAEEMISCRLSRARSAELNGIRN